MKIKKLRYIELKNGDVHFLYVKNRKLYEYECDCSKVISNNHFDNVENCDDYINYLYDTSIVNSLMCCVRKSNIYLLSYSCDDTSVTLSIFNFDDLEFNEIISVDKTKLTEKEDYKIVKEIIKRFL